MELPNGQLQGKKDENEEKSLDSDPFGDACRDPAADCGRFPVSAEPTASGDCGDVHWEFDATTGNISFTGTGDMPGYALGSVSERPWHEYADQIKSVTVGEGITNIGGSAFAYCSKLTTVKVPDGVTYIGSCAFYNCYFLTEINLPDSVIYLSHRAFEGCGRLDNIVIPPNMNVVHQNAFSGCYSLKHLYIRSPQIVKQINDICDDLSTKIVNMDAICIESSLVESVPEYIKTSKTHVSIVVRDGVGYTQYSKNEPSEYTLRGYIQLRPGDGKYDMRFLAEGEGGFLKEYKDVQVTLNFTLSGDDGRTRTIEVLADKAYTSVFANGEKIDAKSGYGFVGVVVTGIGNADVVSVGASVTLRTPDGDTVTYALGSIDRVPERLGDYPVA